LVREPEEAVADAEDFGDAVVVVEFEEGGADDVVEAGAEAAAGDDGRAGLGRDRRKAAGAGRLSRRSGRPGNGCPHVRMEADAGVVGDEVADAVAGGGVEGQRREEFGGAEGGDGGCQSRRHGIS
jgi:hypothetical protein